MNRLESTLELCAENEACFDYCLWEYPPRQPTTGKARSVNLLWHSFEVARLDKKAWAFVDSVRQCMGIHNTVWGVKYINGALSWELYFYDYARLERTRSMQALIDAISPHINCAITPPEQRPYFMFSIDMDNALVTGQRALEEINMYIGNIGSNVSAGICYSLTPESMTLGNHYYFFDYRTEMEDIAGKIACSAHLDPAKLDLDTILWPELLPCQTVVVANKKHNDAIYFSRITIEQLLLFFRRAGYPSSLIVYIEENKSLYDHLLFDVGLDYLMENGKIKILKSGYYGIF